MQRATCDAISLGPFATSAWRQNSLLIARAVNAVFELLFFGMHYASVPFMAVPSEHGTFSFGEMRAFAMAYNKLLLFYGASAVLQSCSLPACVRYQYCPSHSDSQCHCGNFECATGSVAYAIAA